MATITGLQTLREIICPKGNFTNIPTGLTPLKIQSPPPSKHQSNPSSWDPTEYGSLFQFYQFLLKIGDWFSLKLWAVADFPFLSMFTKQARSFSSYFSKQNTNSKASSHFCDYKILSSQESYRLYHMHQTLLQGKSHDSSHTGHHMV